MTVLPQIFTVIALLTSTIGITRSRFKSVHYVTLNYGETRRVPLEKPIEVKGSIKYRYGTIFREVLRIQFDLCTIFDGTSNLVGKVFGAVLKDTALAAFRKCPFPADDIDVKNVSLNDNGWPSIIPTGIYRTEIIFANIMKIQAESEFFSEIRTSF